MRLIRPKWLFAVSTLERCEMDFIIVFLFVRILGLFEVNEAGFDLGRRKNVLIGNNN